MHGGSAGCPMASATSSATLWLCVALGILCTNYGRYVNLNLWCTIVDVEPNLLTCISIVTTRCQRQDGDEVQNKQPLAARVLFTSAPIRLPVAGGVTPPRQNAPHRFCAPLASSRPRILQPNCRRWKWWCWGSRRHNEMIQCSGRGVVDVTGNWLGFAYRQDATQAGVYIIFNDVK